MNEQDITRLLFEDVMVAPYEPREVRPGVWEHTFTPPTSSFGLDPNIGSVKKMDYSKLLAQVDCHFMFDDKPHMSQSSPDKMRYHIWDNVQNCSFMCDTEEDMLGAIIHRHQLIAEQLSQRLTAPREHS